jgi:hypothetical protein
VTPSLIYRWRRDLRAAANGFAQMLVAPGGLPGIRAGRSTFTPTSCSWANAVETFFASLTRQRPQRGAFHSLVDLQAQSTATSASTTANPTPLSGPPIPTALSRRSIEGTKHWRKIDRKTLAPCDLLHRRKATNSLHFRALFWGASWKPR